MSQIEFKTLAEEALSTFAEIADGAQKLASGEAVSVNSLASGNTLTGGQAYQNLKNINQANRDGWEALQREPSIARLLLRKDEDGQTMVVYIARKTSMSLNSGKNLASYGSDMGSLAELPVGEEKAVILKGKPCLFTLIEKTTFHTRISDGEWDSIGNQYRHVDLGVFSIDSLRARLLAGGDELDQLLEQGAAASGIQEGIRHQVLTAMGLRDQPILDQFQGEICRLPLDSQMIILGPPGTGKTTTLIKRLGQKLDIVNLDENERSIANASGTGMPHERNWLMFTPSELLKHYLREAFNSEQVPASDAHIKTWVAYRNDIARNKLGILRTNNGGKYTLKSEMDNLAPTVIADPRAWYEAFREFHDQRLKTQLKDGAAIVVESSLDADKVIAEQLLRLANGQDSRTLVDVYSDLGKQETQLKAVLDKSKSTTDQLLKQERNRVFNRDKEVFKRLAQFLKNLQQDDEPDDEAEFDEDEAETSANQNSGEIPNAVKAYLAGIRSLARSKYRKSSLPKDSRATKVVQWLGDAVPADEVLLEIGKRICFQNGLRHFVNASKRYVADVPTSYRLFRKDLKEDTGFYRVLTSKSNPLHLSTTELDAIVLLILRNCRTLLAQSFIERELDAPRYEYLRNLASLFRNQIMVDEATDFSMLQLACMESLTTLKGRSFFACGDFNQRITHTGVRSMDQITWASPRILAKSVNLIYRQSRALNAFSSALLSLLDGDPSALGELPKESTHEGVKPVLLEQASEDDAARWIAQRIAEVEQVVKTMPTIAVLVNAEEDVKPMAERLTRYLETVNLKAVACEEGRALGEETDVRVFDIRHIKGLEFEAVFFAGVDLLAEQKPELFDRYLYVGATRAATYLGLVCYQRLPAKMQALAGSFDATW